MRFLVRRPRRSVSPEVEVEITWTSDAAGSQLPFALARMGPVTSPPNDSTKYVELSTSRRSFAAVTAIVWISCQVPLRTCRLGGVVLIVRNPREHIRDFAHTSTSFSPDGNPYNVQANAQRSSQLHRPLV